MRKAFLFSVCFVLILSCSREKNAVQNVVKQYARLLMTAYSRPDPDVLDGLVTERQKMRVQQYILYMYKENRIMQCKLVNQELSDIKIKKNKAVVKSSERWDCSFVDKERRRLLESGEIYMYRLEYKLKKERGKWLIYMIKGDEVDESGRVINTIDPSLPTPWSFLSEE